MVQFCTLFAEVWRLKILSSQEQPFSKKWIKNGIKVGKSFSTERCGKHAQCRLPEGHPHTPRERSYKLWVTFTGALYPQSTYFTAIRFK